MDWSGSQCEIYHITSEEVDWVSSSTCPIWQNRRALSVHCVWSGEKDMLCQSSVSDLVRKICAYSPVWFRSCEKDVHCQSRVCVWSGQKDVHCQSSVQSGQKDIHVLTVQCVSDLVRKRHALSVRYVSSLARKMCCQSSVCQIWQKKTCSVSPHGTVQCVSDLARKACSVSPHGTVQCV